MTLFARTPAPEPSVPLDTAAVGATARIDAAEAVIEEHLYAHAKNRQLVDALLDVRNELRRTATPVEGR